MPEEIKTFKKGDQTFDVPVSELDSFMSEVPDAVEINVYESDGKTFDVPVNELDEFMKQVPGATLKSGSKKKVEPLASGPGRDSFNLGSTPESSSQDKETVPDSVGESIINNETEKDPILIRAAEKSPWLAAPINFLTGAVHGTQSHVLKSLNGAQKLFYRGVGALMEGSLNPAIKVAGTKLVLDQENTWWDKAIKEVDTFSKEKLPAPDQSNIFSRLVYTAGDLAPFLATLAVTPNPSIVGVSMKLPVNFGTIAGMGEYSETDDVGKAMKAGVIGMVDGMAIHMVGYGSGEAGAVIGRQLANKFPSLAELAGTTGAASLMFGGGMAHDVAKQVSEGATDIDWNRATDAGATFFAFGAPGILNAAVSTFKQAPRTSIAMARQIDADVNGIRNRAVELEKEAMAEKDPTIKTEKMVAASQMHKMADIKAMDMFFGKNKEESLKWVEKQDISDTDKQVLRDKIEDADMYNQQVELTKDLQKAEETIRKAEEKKAEEKKVEPGKAEKPKKRISKAEEHVEYVETEELPARKQSIDDVIDYLDTEAKADLAKSEGEIPLKKEGKFTQNSARNLVGPERIKLKSEKEIDDLSAELKESRKVVEAEVVKRGEMKPPKEGVIRYGSKEYKDVEALKEDLRKVEDLGRLPLVMDVDIMGAIDAVKVERQKAEVPKEGTGKQHEAFFTEKAEKPSSDVPYEPVIKIDKDTPTAKAYSTYSAEGAFTGHISKMIPGFQEKQISVGEAVTKSGAKSFLDIGASEGGLVKTVASQNPDMKAVALDPNSQMKKNFESTPDVKNAEFVQEAYQGSWTEADGTKISEFKPEEKFDVINEDFTFQFVNNDRAKQVAGVKEILEPDGIFITSEKFHTDNKAANEAKKAEHQEKYFSPEERTADAEGIVTGMDKDMVKDTDYYNTLKDNFEHVEEFWNAGEFKGFIASDSKPKLDKFKSDVGDLTTEFTDAKSKTTLPPPVEGGPPAKVPPKPPKPPEKPAELPEGEGKKPERDVMDVVTEMDKAREAGLKARARRGVDRISYLFWDQQEPFKRAVQRSAKDIGLSKKAQKVLDRKNVEKGSKALTAMEWDAAMKDITGGITGLGPKSMDLVSRYNDMRRTAELYKSREAFGKEELLMEGGVTLKQAEEFLTLVRKKDPSILKQYGLKDYDFKKIREASDKFNDKYRDILTELKDEGIITQEAFDAITFEHPYYSPRKFLSSMDKIDSNGSMSGVEALKGGSEGAKIIDAPSLYYEALARKNNLVARTRTFRAMEQYIADVNPEFMQKAEYDPAFVEKLSKAEEGDPWIEPKFKDTPKGMEAVDYIDANGNKQRIFMDAGVHRYFDIEPFGDLSRKIMHYAGWFSGTKPLKAAATGYNPEFMVKNIPIDMMHILNTTNVYSGALPIAHAQMMADMVKVAKDVVTRSGSYIDFVKEGGGMDMLTGEGRIRTGVSRRKLSKGVQTFDAIEGLASWPGKSSELITRLALRNRHLENAKRDFKKESKREPTVKELKEMQLDATAYSRNYLDFEQGGRLIKMADSVIPYLNAGVQVTRGSLRAAGKNPALYGAKVAQVAVVAGGITAWNMGLFSKDPEEGEAMKNAYLNDISDNVKARNFVVMTPFKYTDASGVEKYVYFKLQKDNAQELITGVAETRVLKEVMGDDAPKYLSNRRLKELQVMTESATNVSQLPPAVRGALGYKLNKDFFYNSELWMGYDLGKDKSLEYKRDTPERYKAVGKIPLPGGHKLSPIRTHYVAKQFLTESNVIATGIGALMDKAVSGASPDLKTEYTPDQVEKFINAPFPRRFFKSTYPGASQQGSDTHQQEYNKIKQENNHGLQKLIDKEASLEEVFTWIGSIIEKGDGDITSLKEYERLSRRYKEEVIYPSVNSWVESLKYVDAVPRAQDLFDQWVHMDDDTRDHLLESAAIAGVLSETTIVKLTSLMDEYEEEMKSVGPGDGKKAKEKKD